MDLSLKLLALVLISFCLGSLPFAQLIARMHGVDLKHIGSGNYGATNLMRACGKVWGATCLFLDALKGYLACLAGAFLFQHNAWAVSAAALLAILGHAYSPWTHFKGGKGAATGLGILCFLSPLALGISVLIATALIASTRYVSLATLCVIWLLPFWFTLFELPKAYTGLAVLAAGFISYKHADNIRRLYVGTEHKISW